MCNKASKLNVGTTAVIKTNFQLYWVLSVCRTCLLILLYIQRGNVVIKALCYNPEGRGFDTRRGEFLNLSNPSDRSRPWGLLSL
jgi:membrane-associated PAP2 superfamily phosphatase